MRKGPLRVAVLAACVAAGLPRPGAAQASAVAGTWDATWAQAVRTSGSEILEIQRWGGAVLILEAHGDSVRGTWRTEAMGITWSVAGTAAGGILRLRGGEHDSDHPELRMVRAVHLEGRIDDDTLEGRMWFELSGLGRAPARRPWRARRRADRP